MNPADFPIHLDEKYGFGRKMDLPALAASCREEWTNHTLCRVNDCVVRVGVVKGEFPWHRHEKEDEFFLVLSGRLLLDLQDETVALGPHEGHAVRRGTLHRTRAGERTVMIMVEGAAVAPLGDAAPGAAR